MIEDLVGILIRVSFLYLFLLLMLRLTGKRSIGSLSALDFIVGLVIGDMVDDVLWNEIPLANGLVGVTAILLVHVLLSFAMSRSQALHTLISSAPTLVISGGKFVQKGLNRERTRREDVYAELRLEGEETIKGINRAQWEPGGKLSVKKGRSK
jgi:uncharacterized membrane protein YcaP (DUF421 family)